MIRVGFLSVSISKDSAVPRELSPFSPTHASELPVVRLALCTSWVKAYIKLDHKRQPNPQIAPSTIPNIGDQWRVHNFQGAWLILSEKGAQ
jgi:hypothetical protein